MLREQIRSKNSYDHIKPDSYGVYIQATPEESSPVPFPNLPDLANFFYKFKAMFFLKVVDKDIGKLELLCFLGIDDQNPWPITA